ncbi:MAG: serine hydroxymethyltransferase, partial [Nitrososphaerales archaeon]
FIPFPYDIKASLPSDYAGFRVYDGSHVMGLIAGGKFQDPLREECSVLMGSTHKSFFGPQGGLILSNDEEVFSKIDSKIYPGVVDNIHWNRVASLSFAMIELLKFGRDYSLQVIKNSKTLARSLDELGVPVKCKSLGFTNSHQVLLGYNEEESPRIANLLQECDIITDIGIRLGTSEVTRRGMKQEEMTKIAHIISDAVGRRVPKKETARRVHRLVREFGKVEYSLSKE